MRTFAVANKINVSKQDIMKKLLLLISVALLASCHSREEGVRKEVKRRDKMEMEINGHQFWFPVVGSVSGQSNGSTQQLVHDPDCRRCAVIRDSVIRSIIREELRNFGQEVE